MKHFISISDHSVDELRHVLDVAIQLKAQLKATGHNEPILGGKSLAMIFEKQSLRTRVSFNVAMTQLGGAGILLRQEEVGFSTREPMEDVARVLSGMCDGIMARTFEHEKILNLARWATVPVINGLTDFSHPCQAMADIMTIQERFGRLAGLKLAFVGDGNNVARSLAVACGKFGMQFVLAAPEGYELPAGDVERIVAQVPNMSIRITRDPKEGARGAHVLYTDTWVSMGQETEKARRMKAFEGYQVNDELLERAADSAVVLHCLPAYRGLEVSAEVMEGPRSLVFPQAENRLHFQKGLLACLMGNK